MKKFVEFVGDEEITAIKKASKWLSDHDNNDISIKEMVSGPNGKYLRISYEEKNEDAAE